MEQPSTSKSVGSPTNRPSISHLISTPDEVQELAHDLAHQYVKYLKVDRKTEVIKYEESIEECLAYLEEVCSALDDYKQKSDYISEFVNQLVHKDSKLNILYDQVDAIEQYLFEMTRLLDQLDESLSELERYNVGGNVAFKKVFDMLPRLPQNVQRLSLFSTINSFIEPLNNQTDGFLYSPSAEGGSAGQSRLVPIEDILLKMSSLEEELARVMRSLKVRITTKTTDPFVYTNPASILGESQTTEQVDGSWQELL